MELQQGLDGTIHFLQYLKIPQAINYVEPFDLDAPEDALVTTNVRGITPPEGKQMRLYMAPRVLKENMQGEGIFCDMLRPRQLEVQLASRAAGFILHLAYISFQDNHFNSAPLYRPPLAAGLDERWDTPQPVIEKVSAALEEAGKFYHNYQAVPFMDITVTSNGRAAAIQSNWKVEAIDYDDM